MVLQIAFGIVLGAILLMILMVIFLTFMYGMDYIKKILRRRKEYDFLEKPKKKPMQTKVKKYQLKEETHEGSSLLRKQKQI